MLHMSGVGAARLLAEPGDHPPAAGPVGTRGLLQTHPQCRGFLPTPQVSVLVPSIFSPLIPYSNTSAQHYQTYFGALPSWSAPCFQLLISRLFGDKD